MKKFFTAVVCVLVLALTLTAFVACNPTEDPTTPPAGGDDTITVTWYQGSKVLKEETLEKGSKATAWTPEAPENKEFTGWFAEASLTQAFDFDAELNEDTDIFAKFTSTAHVADETSYYLIGAGAGDMGKANWDHTAAAANLTMTKTDNATANIYEITITMYAGDMFQICHDGSWDGQVGIGYVVGAEYCDGLNFNDNTTYTAADKEVAQVKVGDTVIFIGADEYNNGFETWNVKLAEGQDGVYKITYTTYPDHPADNKITFQLVEKLDAMTVTHEMHFIGTMNNWGTSYEDGELLLKESDDKATWTGTLVITEEMYADWTAEDADNTLGVKCAAVKLYNTIDGKYYGNNGVNIFLTAGTYSFKYTVEGNVVEYSKCEYYLVGTFVDGEGAAVNFAVKAGVTPALTVEDGIATGTLVAFDAAARNDYNWITAQGKTNPDGEPAVFAFQVVYGSELGIATWHGYNGDNFYVTAGTYTVSFNIATGEYTVTAA
ncbi:MAG: SusF/SusE family outer membrane protein [Clostridia bacterium]|nr:SusF/SusE family outer membrane protein [Clostridia bacterium]